MTTDHNPIKCRCCDVYAVRIRARGVNENKFGWTRRVGDTLEFSATAYSKPSDAFDAAHSHYGRVQ